MTGVFAHWPNRITAMRFVGALVLFAILAVWGEGRTEVEPGVMSQLCFWLFIVIALTDYLYGYLARRDGLVSAFGRLDHFGLTISVLTVSTESTSLAPSAAMTIPV